MKYAWIDAQRKDYGLDTMCSALDVSVSGYRSWKRGGKPNRKRLTDAQMLALIQAIHAEFKATKYRTQLCYYTNRSLAMPQI